MKKPAAYLLVLMTLVMIICLPACKGKPEEDKIKAAVEDMAEGARAKDIARIKGHISSGYKDAAGNDYNAIKGMMLFYFMQQEDISIFLRHQDVVINGDSATVTARAVISRGRKVEKFTDLAPEEASGFVFDFNFNKDGGDWMLTSASWRTVSMAEAL